MLPPSEPWQFEKLPSISEHQARFRRGELPDSLVLPPMHHDLSRHGISSLPVESNRPAPFTEEARDSMITQRGEVLDGSSNRQVGVNILNKVSMATKTHSSRLS